MCCVCEDTRVLRLSVHCQMLWLCQTALIPGSFLFYLQYCTNFIIMEATASHTVARSSSARAHLMVGCAWVGRLAAMTDAGVFGGSCSVAVSLRAGAHVREGGVYACTRTFYVQNVMNIILNSSPCSTRDMNVSTPGGRRNHVCTWMVVHNIAPPVRIVLERLKYDILVGALFCINIQFTRRRDRGLLTCTVYTGYFLCYQHQHCRDEICRYSIKSFK